MTKKEELFKKNFTEFVTEKGMCLSPFWDLFDAGIEAATSELNKGIIQVLTKENAELKAIADFQTSSNIDRYFQLKRSKEQLTKAKELLKRLLEEERDNVFWEMNGADKSSYFQVVKQAEQFLKEAYK